MMAMLRKGTRDASLSDENEVVLQIRDLDAEEAQLTSSGTSISTSSSSSSSSSSADGNGAAADAVQAMLLNPVSPANVGSLLRFFQSMFFDSWITISYLYKFREHAGVCDYLCNELYKFQERDIEKYIPQLCILLLNKKEKDNSLARFMMDKCASSMHFALQIAWQLQAYITYGGDRLPTTPQEKEFKERCLRLHEEVEIATVNCKSSLRLRALVDFSPFVAPTVIKGESAGAVEEGDQSLDPQLHAKRLVRSLSDRRNSVPQHINMLASKESTDVESSVSSNGNSDGQDNTTATEAEEPAVSSGEESEGEKDNELYKDKKEDEEESYRKWDAVLHDDVLPQEDAMHIIIGLSKRERAQYYSNVVSFVDKLIDIGEKLILLPEDQRKERLERDIRYLGEHLVDGLYLPICGATDSHHCIVRLLPAEAIPLHSKARVPYLFYYEIIESREKCSAPNLHSFNLETARLSAGVPEVLSPFEEPEPIEDTKSKAKTSPRPGSAVQKAEPTSSIKSPTPLTPAKRVKETSIVQKMGFYTEQNLALLDEERSTSPFDEEGSPEGEAREAENEDEDDDQYAQVIGRDAMRSESDAAMLEKLYEMGKKDTEQSSNEHQNDSHQDASYADAQAEQTQSPPQDSQTSSTDNPEITLCSIFGECWKDKENRIRKESPFSHLPNWKLAAVIVKSGDDLRQEQLASQLLSHFKDIFENAMLPLFLYPLRILVTSADSGLIELIPDSISLHQLKKRTNCMSLAKYFKTVYRTQEAFDKARLNFVESMAAYSLVCYFLQVKDRHNGNIMIDSEGHIIHIDYGFFIFNSPGSLNFESAPFKLTPEFVEVMGGVDSKLFAYYKDLLFRGFMEARKYHEKIILILEIWLLMSKHNTSVLPCLAGGKAAVDAMTDRFKMGYTEKECRDYVDYLINSSLGNWRTREYDRFQFLTRGVLYSS